MRKKTRFFDLFFVAIMLAAASASTPANAWPLGRLFHLHPHEVEAQDTRVFIHLYNGGTLFRDVKVGDHVYTMMPQEYLSIKAPAGTGVYAESSGFGHRRGDLLFAITPAMNFHVVSVH